MNKFGWLTITLLIAFNNIFGQVRTDDKPNILAGKFGWGMGDVPESWDNLKMEKISSFIPDQDTLAIRICSTDPLLAALETSFISPIKRAKELETQGVLERDIKTGEPKNWQYYVPKNRVVLLRQNKGCRIFKNKPADVEFWIVHPQNELPKFVEKLSISEISEFNIISGDVFFKDECYEGDTTTNHYSKGENLTPEIYKKALAKIVEFVKNKRTVLIVIKSSFYGRFPDKSLSRRITEAQNFLKKNGIENHRLFVRNFTYENNIASKEYLDKYPNISIVYEN